MTPLIKRISDHEKFLRYRLQVIKYNRYHSNSMVKTYEEIGLEKDILDGDLTAIEVVGSPIKFFKELLQEGYADLYAPVCGENKEMYIQRVIFNMWNVIPGSENDSVVAQFLDVFDAIYEESDVKKVCAQHETSLVMIINNPFWQSIILDQFDTLLFKKDFDPILPVGTFSISVPVTDCEWESRKWEQVYLSNLEQLRALMQAIRIWLAEK